MGRENELHINIDQSSINLLMEINDDLFNNNVKLKELVRYCIQMAYIYIKKLDAYEFNNVIKY